MPSKIPPVESTLKLACGWAPGSNNKLISVLLGVCALAFTLLACSVEPTSDQKSKTHIGGGSAVAETIRPPREAIVVIRDIAGFFDDCGCAGEVRGGIARARAATLAAQRVTWVFVGRLVVPRKADLSSSQLELYASNLQSLVSATRTLLDELGNVVWVPSQDELELLRSRKIDYSDLDAFAASSSTSMTIGGLAVNITDSIYLSPISVTIDLPYENSRAREIVVLAFWENDSGKRPVYMEELGAIIPASKNSAKTRSYIASKISRSLPPVVTGWRTHLHLQDPAEDATQALVDDYNLTLVHSWQSASRLPIRPMREAVVQEFESCSTCHANAVASWAQSRHAGAYDTLALLSRHRDMRCIACHTAAVNDDGSLGTAIGRLAVTCASCHDDESHKDRCEGCHTDATDPKGHFLSSIHTVCDGSSDPLTGSCMRK